MPPISYNSIWPTKESPMPTLLYLHGFNSSSQSKKALQTQHWLAENAPEVEFICPDLPPFANQAFAIIEGVVESCKQRKIAVIGSSMGGFYATCLVEKYNMLGVLINPAVSPARGLDSWIGENENYITGEKWVFEQHHIAEFKALDPPVIRYPHHYMVLLQTADAVLDYRDAQMRYQGATVVIEEGGDHSFMHYEQHLPDIYQFLMMGTS